MTSNAVDWQSVRAELLTNADARELAGEKLGRSIDRAQLLRWRRREEQPFPAPVITIKTAGGEHELWSRSQVMAWLTTA